MVLDKAMEWRKLSFVFTNSTLHTLGCIFTQILSRLYIALRYKSTLHIMQILLMNRHSHHLQGFPALYWIGPECLEVCLLKFKMCDSDLLFSNTNIPPSSPSIYPRYCKGKWSFVNSHRTFNHLTPSAPYASCACFAIVQTISCSTLSKKLNQLTQNLPPLGPFVAGSWTSWTPARIEMRTTGKGRLCRNVGEDLREDLDVCWMRRGVFWGQNGKK